MRERCSTSRGLMTSLDRGSGHLTSSQTRHNDSPRAPSTIRPDGTNARTLARSIAIQGSGGQGSADWSPDGAWIVAAGADEHGQGLFKIPVDGGAPVRLVSNQVVNPVWSPDGALIVYGGPVVGG